MRTFNYSEIKKQKWDSDVLSLIAAIYKEAGKQEIRELCPSLSVSSIEGSLRKLVASGELKREGSGKNTCYFRIK